MITKVSLKVPENEEEKVKPHDSVTQPKEQVSLKSIGMVATRIYSTIIIRLYSLKTFFLYSFKICFYILRYNSPSFAVIAISLIIASLQSNTLGDMQNDLIYLPSFKERIGKSLHVVNRYLWAAFYPINLRPHYSIKPGSLEFSQENPDIYLSNPHNPVAVKKDTQFPTKTGNINSNGIGNKHIDAEGLVSIVPIEAFNPLYSLETYLDKKKTSQKKREGDN